MTHRSERVEQPTIVTRHYDVKCDGCDKQLNPGFPHTLDKNGGWDCLWPEEGLQLRLYGNYPSVWDNLQKTFLLCDNCVEILRKVFPVIGQQLQDWRNGLRSR